MVNFNGQIVPSEQPIFTGVNRAFRYGDGMFESIRVFDGKMLFFEYHFRRLQKGMAALKINMPSEYTSVFFRNEILKTIENNKIKNHRVRLTVFRSGNGLYTPQNNAPAFYIEAQIMPSNKFEWNEKGLEIGLFDEIKINPSPVSFFKSCNALPYVMANIYKKEKGWDDVILMNHQENIVCGGSSNVFFVKNGVLLSPPISDGCVAGTMREVVFELANKLKIETKECSFPVDELATADEIFLTNAIQGIRWVGNVAGKETDFKSNMSYRLFEALNEFMVV